MRIAKTKMLISCAVTAQLICVFVFAYAKSRFSHNEAHIVGNHLIVNHLDVMAHSCSSTLLCFSLLACCQGSKPVLESFGDIQCVFLEDSRRHCIFL